MIWGAMTSAGVGSFVFYQVQSQCSHLPGDFGALQVQVQVQDLFVTYTIIQRVLTSSEM